MGLLENFMIAFVIVFDRVLLLLAWVIIIRALISWVNPDPYNMIVQILHRLTEPILEPIRRLLPPMGVDLSPLIAIFGIMFLRVFFRLSFGV